MANGVVYIGNYDGNLYAFNAATGALLWNYTTGEHGCFPARRWRMGLSMSVVMTITSTHSMRKLGRFSGTTRQDGRMRSSPAVVNGVVYVGSDDKNLYALDATSGALLWKYTTGGSVSSSPAVANGVVYFGSYDNNTYALDATSGALLWKYTTGNRVSSSPAVANGVVYVGSWDNNLYALDAATGTLPLELHDRRGCDFQPGGGERCRLYR